MPVLDKVGPVPSAGWPVTAKKIGASNSNYCVLGVNNSPCVGTRASPQDVENVAIAICPGPAAVPATVAASSTGSGYVPVLNVVSDYKKDGYVKSSPFACDSELQKPDSSSTQSPYVIAVDPSMLASRKCFYISVSSA